VTEHLPDPDPTRFPDLEASHVYTTESRDRLVRVFSPAGEHPMNWDDYRHFGPLATGRFDHHPDGEARHHPRQGVWYAAIETGTENGGLATALAERFQDSRTVPLGDRFHHLVVCHPGRSLTLLNMRSGWITKAGGNAAIGSGRRDRSRTWAREIHRTYPALDGIVWSSSVYPPGNAIVLWSGEVPALAASAIAIAPLAELLPYVVRAANTLGYTVAL